MRNDIAKNKMTGMKIIDRGPILLIMTLVCPANMENMITTSMISWTFGRISLCTSFFLFSELTLLKPQRVTPAIRNGSIMKIARVSIRADIWNGMIFAVKNVKVDWYEKYLQYEIC